MENSKQEYLLFKPESLNLKNASKIFFACHPNDFKLYFDNITSEILEKTADNNISAVFSYINPNTAPSFDDVKGFLDSMQLIVIPITWELLQTPNMTIRELVPYALEKHIPILPLLQDLDSANEYSKHFGNIQFLCDNKNDKTAIPYEIKLNEFLKDTLVGDELRARVQTAFDAYIFLSYRKKDRSAAQEIMHLIHKNEFCRDVAIWYDEFLAPGEDFNASIQKAIEKSDLFAMVITPNIVEPDNYIILHEYPMADTAKKAILPLESVETDKNELSECYKNIPACTDAHNGEALSKALLRNLKTAAREESNDSPEHNYLIGLAYLTGIDVEVNHERGIELIRKAAEADLPEAVARMATIYRTGMGCDINYNEYDFWTNRLVDIYKKLYPKYDSGGWLRLMHSFYNRILLHTVTGSFLSAKSDAEQAIFYAKAVQKENDIYYVCHVLSFAYITLAGIEQLLVANNSKNESDSVMVVTNSFKAALPNLKQAEKVLESYTKRHPTDNCDMLKTLIYSQLLSTYSELRELSEAKKYVDKLTEIFIAQNNQLLIDELNFQWLSLKKMIKVDFTNEENAKEYFGFLVEHLEKKEISKETAASIFQMFCQLYPIADPLLTYSKLESHDIDVFKCYIKKCLHAYKQIPEKYITNFILSSASKILLLAASFEKRLGDKEKEYFYWQEYLKTLDVILSRHKTIENKKSLQKALSALGWLALSIEKPDDAFAYIGRNHKLCEEIAKELNNDENAYIDCVNHFNLTSHYFLYKGNSEKCLEFAKVACDMAASVCKMFDNSVNTLFNFANVRSNYVDHFSLIKNTPKQYSIVNLRIAFTTLFTIKIKLLCPLL